MIRTAAACLLAALASPGLLAGRNASAQDLDFPPPPATAAAAATSFDARAAAIILFNACGREHEYANIRYAMQHGDFGKQGEGLLGIITAKVAFLTDPRFANVACDHELNVPRTLVKGTRDPVDPTVEAFALSVLGAFLDPSTPTRCSFPTSVVNATEEKLAVKFRVDRPCLRQQINEGLRSMSKTTQMGTDDLICLEAGIQSAFLRGSPEGDFDVVVRDAVRVLYMGTMPGREVLDADTITHLYEHILAARDRLADSEYSQISDCNQPAGDDLGTPEDYADREYWYNELASALGDFFKWLLSFPLEVTVGALTAASGLTAAPFLLIAGEDPTQFIALDVAIPETENHRLMIEASKYLTNDAIIRELKRIDHDNIDEIEEKQVEVREWLLQALQRIAIHDFDEYNSRPYTRYSLNAILNLYDFARDDQMRTAAQIVLDLSAAKFAAASNRGRRIVPFRRLADNDWKLLYEGGSGADHEVMRAFILSGQTQLLPNGISRIAAAEGMIYAAVSRYRLPHAVLEAAVERKGQFAQEIGHAGAEGYFASPAFTMSLGGLKTPSAISVFGISKDVDKGVAMPTILIPTSRGLTMEDLFFFRGVGQQHQRGDNLCGWKGFICGIQPEFSSLFSHGALPKAPPCMSEVISTSSTERRVFMNSAKCPGPGPHFYLAAQLIPCTAKICGRHHEGIDFGFMEIVEAPDATGGNDPKFAQFHRERQVAFATSAPDADGIGSYQSAAGDLIRYRVHRDLSTVLEVNGAPRTAHATRGAIINSQGDGRIEITGPWTGASVSIDFTDWSHPKRRAIP